MTPLEMREQQFRTALRGFDRKAVSSAFAELAGDYEDALREVERWRDDLARAQAVLGEHREQERNLRATLQSAQKLAEDIRHTAEQESQRIIAQAQARAAALVDEAPPELGSLERELGHLRAARAQAATELDATLATLRGALEAVKAG
jgi:cell division initiation protein